MSFQSTWTTSANPAMILLMAKAVDPHNFRARITVDPNRMSGLPCIRDTRVTVSAVLGQLAAGRSEQEVLDDYPYLEHEDILAALEYGAAAVAEREIPAVPSPA
jgi:uncharacterized protein (DUF433 family)